MTGNFVLRSGERGYTRLASTGPNASYVAGHPDGVITRHSSFNFHDYQSGIAGFGKIRVFGDEVFTGRDIVHVHEEPLGRERLLQTTEKRLREPRLIAAAIIDENFAAHALKHP